MTEVRPKAKDPVHLVRFERNFLSGILETTNALIVVLDTSGRILRLNRAIEHLAGFSSLESVGNIFWEEFLAPEERTIFSSRFEGTPAANFPFEAQTRLKAKCGGERHILWSSNAIPDEEGGSEFVIVTGIDITALKEAEREKEALIQELKTALSNVKTLRGLLPMCASCRKIRDDHGYWQQVETYIRDHSDADFTHGICPECAKRLYPEYAKIFNPDKGN